MNKINPYLKEYKKNQVETATPEQVLILLFDGAIQYLNRAKVALNEGNNAQFHSNLLGCEKILMEFMNTLDMRQGGSLAENLYKLYDYYYRTLINSGISRNLKGIDEVLKHLIGLRETWQKAIEIANAEKETKLIYDDEKEELNQNYDEYEDGYDNDEDEEYEEDDADEVLT